MEKYLEEILAKTVIDIIDNPYDDNQYDVPSDYPGVEYGEYNNGEFKVTEHIKKKDLLIKIMDSGLDPLAYISSYRKELSTPTLLNMVISKNREGKLLSDFFNYINESHINRLTDREQEDVILDLHLNLSIHQKIFTKVLSQYFEAGFKMKKIPVEDSIEVYFAKKANLSFFEVLFNYDRTFDFNKKYKCNGFFKGEKTLLEIISIEKGLEKNPKDKENLDILSAFISNAILNQNLVFNLPIKDKKNSKKI